MSSSLATSSGASQDALSSTPVTRRPQISGEGPANLCASRPSPGRSVTSETQRTEEAAKHTLAPEASAGRASFHMAWVNLRAVPYSRKGRNVVPLCAQKKRTSRVWQGTPALVPKIPQTRERGPAQRRYHRCAHQTQQVNHEEGPPGISETGKTQGQGQGSSHNDSERKFRKQLLQEAWEACGMEQSREKVLAGSGVWGGDQ